MIYTNVIDIMIFNIYATVISSLKFICGLNLIRSMRYYVESLGKKEFGKLGGGAPRVFFLV
jgi:hypothetical protein